MYRRIRCVLISSMAIVVSVGLDAEAQNFGRGGGAPGGFGGGGGGYSPAPRSGGYSPPSSRPGGAFDPRPQVPVPGNPQPGYSQPGYSRRDVPDAWQRSGLGSRQAGAVNTPHVYVPGHDYEPPPSTSWHVPNPFAVPTYRLPSTGRIDVSAAGAALPHGALTPELSNVRSYAAMGQMNEVTKYVNDQMARSGNDLGAMFTTVSALGRISNPAYQTMRNNTLALARARIAQGSQDALPWAVVAQMSLQDRNDQQFAEATRRLMESYPQSGYSHYFQGVQHLQNREYHKAQLALERARELGMSEESIAELLKTAIDSQKWIWEYALILLIVVVVWLAGLGVLAWLGDRYSRWTLARLQVDGTKRLDVVNAGDLRRRKRYRRVVGFAAVYYYFSLPILVATSVALPMALGYAVLSVPYLNLILLGLTLFLGAAGIVTAISGLRTAFLRVPDVEEGRIVTSEEAPSLWKSAHEVAEKVGTRCVDEIRLVVGCDVYVYEQGSYLKRLRDRARRVMILGLGALEGMKLDALKAVLAHEYAHFHHRDTAGGDIALRAFQSMNRFVLAVVRRGKIRRWDVAVHFLIFYRRMFRRLAFGAGRLQELFADQTAVKHFGADAFRSGLSHVIRRSIEFDWAVGKAIEDSVRSGKPVADFHRRTPSPEIYEREDLERAFLEIVNRPTDVEDTHPSPRERFESAALYESSAPSASSEAAIGLFHDGRTVLSEINQSLDRHMSDRAQLIAAECAQSIVGLTRFLVRQRHPDALAERARFYMEKGDYASAAGDLTELLSAAPEVVGFRYGRGFCRERLGEYSHAIDDYVAAARLVEEGGSEAPQEERDKTRVRILLRLANCYVAAKRADEALRTFTQALSAQPTSLSALVGRANLLRRCKQHAKAMEDLNAAVREWPTAPEPFFERALIYEAHGRNDLAERDRRTGAALDYRSVRDEFASEQPRTDNIAAR